MATIKRNSINLDTTNNADGFDLSGGTAKRKLTVSDGDVAISGNGSGNVISYPNRTTTLLGEPDAPTIVSVGSSFTSTAAPTATLPGTHAANDILLLILQTGNDSAITAPAGYTYLGPQNGIGAAATAGSTKLAIFWKRDGGGEVAPTIPDTGDHTFGIMLAVRGCVTMGDPIHFLDNSWEFTASTAATSTNGSDTCIDNSLVMTIFAHGIDSATAQASGVTNASLTSLTTQFDGGTTDGIGGGVVVVTGVKDKAGEMNAFTHTWAASTVDVSTLLAFVPTDLPSVRVRRTEIQTFIGSPADLDDTWVNPSGARQIKVQICDGGGGGSGGNTTTTPAGGGGGGGGGYDEAWYDPHDLAATITVHAGRGGNAGTALNQAGSQGVLSQFDKGGTGTLLTSALRIAGVAATAAASANGGDGGSGSGAGVTSKAVGTRIALHDATAGVALGKVGGRGGNGSTGSVGGSPSEWGGGGGESGCDTDSAILANLSGYSMRGGGGGAGGRTSAVISNPGSGGGAVAVASAQGATGIASTRLPYGGAGGCNGGSTVVTGGTGGFPGGGGGGGAGVAGGFGGAGGHGCVMVTTFF